MKTQEEWDDEWAEQREIYVKNQSFTNQKPRIATQEDLEAPWSGGKPGEFFRCKLCGYKFQLGDYWRWVFVKGYTNILVCEPCDIYPEVKWIQTYTDWENLKKYSRFWYFISNLERHMKDY